MDIKPPDQHLNESPGPELIKAAQSAGFDLKPLQEHLEQQANQTR